MYPKCKYYSTCVSPENCSRCPEKDLILKNQILVMLKIGLKYELITKEEVLSEIENNSQKERRIKNEKLG